jgi:hypothetical protein
MQQGYSGSTVRRIGHLVEKWSSDEEFAHNRDRQADLLALSRRLTILPRIDHIDGQSIFMDYIEGHEGITEHNAHLAGQALRLLHAQTDYSHPCMTGVDWLIQLANENLSQTSHGYRVVDEIAVEYQMDALIHSEPTQFIQKHDGAIVFIDFEGIGLGSRYQDIGFIYYRAMIEGKSEIFTRFILGYESDKSRVDKRRVAQMAGIIALAYAGFADFDKRVKLGIHLLDASGRDA